MATQVQYRRGTTAEHSGFTGAVGEITVDTTLDTIRVHNGSTAAGIRLAKFSEIPTTFSFTAEADDSAGVSVATDGSGKLRFTGDDNLSTSTDSAGTVTTSLNGTISVDHINARDSSAVVIEAIQIQDNTITSVDSTQIQFGGEILTGVGDPLAASDAATKSYVDTQLSSLSSNSIDLTATNTTASTHFITFAEAATGNEEIRTDTDLTYNPNTNTISGGSATFTSTVTTDILDVNTIQSTDSSEIHLNESLSISGTLKVNEITADDSSEVTINNIRTQVLVANDSTEILINDALRVSGTITGTVTEALYADLAERYTSDAEYDEGTVVVFGGDAEITESTQANDTRIAGVISTAYAYLMNKDEQGPAVALKGKVLCKVVGSVSKGDILVPSTTPGHAEASDSPNPMAVVGRSMVDDSETVSRKIYIQV